MITVPEAARRAGRDPETVRRWIRSGKLRSTKVGTQHMIDEDDLTDLVEPNGHLPLPERWKYSRFAPIYPQLMAALRDVRDIE